MPKVIVHNLSIQYRQYDPSILQFDQNAVFFAEPEDVVITRKPIVPEYLYFLESIGLLKSGMRIIHPETPRFSPAAIFEDACVALSVAKYIENCPAEWKFDCFCFTEWEEKWTRALGLLPDEDYRHRAQWEGKSGFRFLAKKLGLSVPPGFEYCMDAFDGFSAVLRLALRGYRRIIIKQDEGSAGLGTRLLNLQEFFASPLRLNKYFPDQWGWGMVPRHSFAFVVEAWLEDIELSPSVQLYVSEKGTIILSMHLQLFEANNVTYRGCRSYQWIPEALRGKLAADSLKFAEGLRQEGFRGHVGLNSIVRKNGELLWTEANLRRVMSSYPQQIVRRVLGDAAANAFYISTRMRRSSWSGLTIERFLARLAPVLFTNEKKCGIIPYDYGLLERNGTVFILAVASSKEKAERLIRYAERA